MTCSGSALKSMTVQCVIRIIAVKSKNAVCAFLVVPNFTLEGSDGGGFSNGGGVGEPKFFF